MVDNVLVDTDNRGGDLSQLEKDLSEAVSVRKGASDTKKQKQQNAGDSSNDDVDAALPPKLRGKTREQIADMYANLESTYGRMANDLGTQRKLTDRLLDLKRDTDLGNNGQPAKVEIKSSELLENPTAALERFHEGRDRQAAQERAEMEAKLAAHAVMTQHPDYVAVAQSPEFAEWVQASPIRIRAVKAAQNGDWSAAGDLLTDYKAQRPATKVDEEEEIDDDAAARKAAKKASLESNSQGTPSTGKKGKVYKRADLMRFRAEHPDKWEDPDFQAEIISAYNEGRVK
jgi:hypothetical protein